jgi:anti-anti-sigma factor
MILVARPTGLLTSEKTPMTFNQKFSPPRLERGACPGQPAAAKAATLPHARQPIVVALPSEIDLTNASQLHDALTRARESGTAVVVADATETTFCDCAGVCALVRAHHQATAAGTNLRVASATSPTVRRILELTGADQVLDAYPMLTAALDGPPRAPGAHSRSAQAATGPAPREHAIADSDEGTA